MSDIISELSRRLAKPKPGGVILFTGAGFSYGATNTKGEDIPFASDFASELARRLGESPKVSLDVISDIYDEQNPGNSLVQLIIDTFTCETFSKNHSSIMNYPWKRIYTTNYDDLAELTVGRVKSLPAVFTRKTLPLNLSSKELQIIHLNGYVKSTSKATTIDDFALTLSNYVDSSLFDSRWATLLRQDFQLADTIIFVGYSMYDLDISRILTMDPEIKSKTFLIQHDGISRGDELNLRRYGSLLKIGLNGLAEMLDKVISEGVSPTTSSLENFKEFLPPAQPEIYTVRTKDVELLLERGVIDKDIIYSNLSKESSPYLARRALCKQVITSIEQEKSSVVLHADIGNGKSIIIEQVKRSMLEKGYRIFELSDISDNVSYDIAFFNDLSDKFIIVIEDLITNKDILDIIRERVSKFRILSTVRSSIYEVKSADIKFILGPDYIPVDANLLDKSDYNDISNILTKGGYWGELHNKSQKDKNKYIEKKCGSQLRSVILGLLESSSVSQKIQEVFRGEWQKNKELQQFIIISLCINVVEDRADFRTISEMLGFDVFKMTSDMRDDGLKEFFSISNNKFEARSSILSEYILRKFVKDETIIEVIYTALSGSERFKGKRRNIRELSKKLMRFSFIEKILSKTDNKSSKLVDFYDRIGDIGYRNFNPQYWLQYAIASLAFNDYRSADKQFVTAFSLAQDYARKYDTYQIDNQYARFLLESRTSVDYWSDYFDSFKRAHILTINQMKDVEQGYYPYRVVGLYNYFIEKRISSFNRSHLKEIQDMCLEILEHTRKSSEKIKKNRLVKSAISSVELSLQTITERQQSKGW